MQLLLSRKLFLSSMVLFVLLSFSSIVSVEASSLMWSQFYGGTEEEHVHALIATSDGGYAVAGQTESFGAGGYDVWLVKTDWFGNVEWNRTYGGTEGDFAFDLIETSDGGYALAGSTSSFGLHNAVFLVKTDAVGYMEWNKTYGGLDIDGGNSLVATPDGGYMIAGHTKQSFGDDNLDFWLIKTDASGNMEWNQTYGGTKRDVAHSLVATSDGGYAIAGETKSFGAGINDFWLVKTDASGNMEWNQTYGGKDIDSASSLIVTSDGGYALAGETKSFGAGRGDFWLVKTDAYGNVEWNQTYGEPLGEKAYSLAETLDGGYIMTGDTRVFSPGGYDCWLVKTDEFGNMEWNQVYGGKEHYRAFSVIATSDGGYAVACETCASDVTDWDFWLVKIEGTEYTPELKTYEFDFSYNYDLYVVVVSTNSTLGGFGFGENQNQINFNVTGTTGTTGYCKIIIPEDLVGKDVPVYLNGTLLTEGVDYTQTCNGTHTIFEITYSHSTHLIEIMGISTVPEYSSLMFPTLLLTFALVIVIHKKRLFSGKS
jgi:hypothetical protein